MMVQHNHVMLHSDRGTTMMARIVQMAIIVVWAAPVVLHSRRLVQLAHINTRLAPGGQFLRQHLQRIWWWLGREEFWRAVQADTVRCLEITLMILLLAWMM